MDPLLMEQLLAAAQARSTVIRSARQNFSKCSGLPCMSWVKLQCLITIVGVACDEDESLPSRLTEWLTCKKIRVSTSLCGQQIALPPCLGRLPIWQGKPRSELHSLKSENLKNWVTCAMRIYETARREAAIAKPSQHDGRFGIHQTLL